MISWLLCINGWLRRERVARHVLDRATCQKYDLAVPSTDTTAGFGDGSTLTIDFAGEIHVLSPGDELTFGRGKTNDLEVDSNPRLHRKFGHISYRDGNWWLRNNGNRLAITVLDQASPSSSNVTPGRETSLTFIRSTVRFKAGSSTYELLLELPLPAVEAHQAVATENDIFAPTIDQSHLPLVGNQRLLAVALAEYKLLNPHKPLTVPTNKTIAHRFGWSTTTYNRKLDRLCKNYALAGVSGLVGGPGQVALDRRTKLVEHLVSSGSVTLLDLDLLKDHPE